MQFPLGRIGRVHSSRQFTILQFILAILVPAGLAEAQVSVTGYGGSTISVGASGNWAVVTASPAWTFAGSLGAPASGVTARSDSDNIGTFQEIDFWYMVAGSGRSAFIRAYSGQPLVLFSTTLTNDSTNSAPFPSVASYPANLYNLSFSGEFSLPQFSALAPDSPWVFFDGAAETFIVSPAANYMIAAMAQESNGAIDSGINSSISILPAGFTHATLLAYGNGIDATLRTWGMGITGLSGKQRPANDADTLLNAVSYWTDNTSTYYYNPGGPSYTGTLESIKAEFAAKGIALGSLQLDSWWYPKGPGDSWSSSGGIWIYNAAPDLFPYGLAAFQASLGTPLITHARWIDAASPYRGEYLISGNVATDPAYWEMVANYLQSSGVHTYEQDWLGANAYTEVNLTDPFAFMDNMAAAMARHGLTMQYCMGDPKHFLQSTHYNNATTARTSQDGFSSARWTEFLYSSRFASAVGLWPFSDVFMSTDANNLLLATLSAGPVGIGDALGSISRTNLMKAVRPDGVIVKPDVPAVPLDSVYIADAQAADAPMVASAWTDYGGLRAHFIFAYVRQTNAAITINPADFGISGASYLYDDLNGAGIYLAPGSTWAGTLDGGVRYFILVPVGQTGIAFLGDSGQFVTLGKKRIPAVTDQGRLDVTVAFAEGEKTRTLFGYSPQPVAATALSGSVSGVMWDSSTQLFTLVAHANASGSARVRIVESFLGDNPAGTAGGCGRRCSGNPEPNQ